jgi:hypothetical protein
MGDLTSIPKLPRSRRSMSMDGAQHCTHRSTSSAIEFVTSAGIGQSSPALVPSGDGRNSLARRRLSWGRVESGQDPLRLHEDLFSMNDPGPSSRPSLSFQPPASYTIDDDPISPTQLDTFRASTATSVSDYSVEPYAYTNHSRASASTTSLMSNHRESSTSTFDDSAHLIANMSSEQPYAGTWLTDSEDTAAATPRTRRRTQRYSAELTPLSHSGTAIKSISQGLRRVSIRVVNFASSSPEGGNRVRLGSDGRVEGDNDEEEKVSEPLPESLSNMYPLRGRTLGFFGPTNRVRLAMYSFLIFPCVACFFLSVRLTSAQVDRSHHFLFDPSLRHFADRSSFSHPYTL